MRTSKRTSRRKVAGRPMDPYGNDIFDIIDYHFTYRRAVDQVREELRPWYWKAKRKHEDVLREVKSQEKDIETLQQVIKDKEDRLKQVSKESREADQLRKEIKKHKDEIKELTEEGEWLEGLFQLSSLMNKIYEDKLNQMAWTFQDNRGRVLAKGGTKEELIQEIFAKLKGGGGDSLSVFWRLKDMVRESGPAFPLIPEPKESFADIMKFSKSPQDLVKRLAKDQPGAVRKFINYIDARPRTEKFIRRLNK